MTEYQCNSNCASPHSMKESSGYNDMNHSNCGCESSSCEVDPIGMAKQMLESSFFTAMKEVHVEKLKKIIDKEWGNHIEQAAALAIKHMEKEWQASISKSVANKEFYNELSKIMTSENK